MAAPSLPPPHDARPMHNRNQVIKQLVAKASLGCRIFVTLFRC
jgi:hypothetical protein